MILEGVLIKAFGGFYFVQAEGRVYACSLRGRLKQELKGLPLGLLVGDRVLLESVPAGNAETDGAAGVITGLLPRRSCLVRPKIANIEQCLIVLAAEHPKPDLLLLDRLLASLLAAAVCPLLCFNKLDRPGAEELFAELRRVYGGQAGFAVFGASALRGEGLAELEQALRGRLTAVAGPSGVGKSTLLNCLQKSRPLATGEISRKLRRGRHTTRAVELLELGGGGWIADTPGFSRLEFSDAVTADKLAAAYPEMREPAGRCRFDMCRHDREPDCAVKRAVAEGRLDGARYQRYLTLLAALED